MRREAQSRANACQHSQYLLRAAPFRRCSWALFHFTGMVCCGIAAPLLLLLPFILLWHPQLEQRNGTGALKGREHSTGLATDHFLFLFIYLSLCSCKPVLFPCTHPVLPQSHHATPIMSAHRLSRLLVLPGGVLCSNIDW